MSKNKRNPTHRERMTGVNVRISNALLRAESDTYELYYLYLREHPEYSGYLEELLFMLDRSRGMVRDFQQLCWEYAPKHFDDVGTMGELIVEARRDVLGDEAQWPGYLDDLDRGVRELSRLRLELGARLRQPFHSLSLLPQKLQPQK